MSFVIISNVALTVVWIKSKSGHIQLVSVATYTSLLGDFLCVVSSVSWKSYMAFGM